MEILGSPRGTPPGGSEGGDDPSEVGLHSLRIGAATTLAAGGEVSQRGCRERADGSPRTLARYTPTITQMTQVLYLVN